MKSTIDIAKECGAEFEPVNSEILHSFSTDIFIFSPNAIEAFRKAVEAEFVSRCELVANEITRISNGEQYIEYSGNENKNSNLFTFNPLYTLPTITE